LKKPCEATEQSRRIILVTVLSAVSLGMFLVSLSFGGADIGIKKVVTSFLDYDTGDTLHRIIQNIRLPRTLAAALAGMLLSLSGTILQGVMKNPLASPNIIGVNAGAGLGGIGIMILFPSHFHLVPPVAFFGALTSTLIIYGISRKQGEAQPFRLILSGIALSSFLGAGVQSLLTFFPDHVHSVIGFMVGGLSAMTWIHVDMLWPYAVAGLIISLVLSNRLNLLLMGDDSARSLGLSVERNRLMFIVLASLTAASAVSVVGLLGFVGLLAPHMTRLIVGSDHRILIPSAALLGSSLLMGCDILARTALHPVEIPVGIIMAFLGAPFFLFLLRRRYAEH
jgi:iron complex transport system permease protein